MKKSFAVARGGSILYVDKPAAYSTPHSLAARFGALSVKISLYKYSLIGGEPMFKSARPRWLPLMSWDDTILARHYFACLPSGTTLQFRYSPINVHLTLSSMPTFTFVTNQWKATRSLLWFTQILMLFCVVSVTPVSSQTANSFNGFEVGLSPGWDAFGMSLHPTRVSSGTNGITSSTGSWHAQVGTGAATNFGGYHSVFPTCGYKTSVDIYLNKDGGWANDTRVDYTSAVSNTVGAHRRDFVFAIGFYNDNDGLGAGTNRFIISRGNNTPGWPKNPSNPKFMINQTGWYRFEHTFRKGAGDVLEVDLKVYQILTTGAMPQVGSTFTLSDPTDIIGSTVGGNRYGWILNNAFSTLAIDNSYLWPVSLVTNLNTMNTYCTIQAAVNAASDNDVLEVSEGISNERVTINRPLTLQGVGETQCIVYGAGLGSAGSGIAINNNITNVTIQDLTVRNFVSNNSDDAGIAAKLSNNDLIVQRVTIHDNTGGRGGLYANGPISDVLFDDVTSYNHTPGARGIVIWNNMKSNVTITNCEVYNNNCCGIELQDGAASGVTMNNNNVYNNADNGIGLIGLDGTVGPNVISSNTLLNNGRFGMEIKNPNGATTISNNTVTRTVPIVDLRDIAGIAIHRRGVLAPPQIVNVDIPTGVTVTGNTVSGYVQTSDSDGFGIVVEGTFHTVTGNTVSGNDVGIQQQAGHTPYPADGNQNNIPDQYFGRGNAQTTCGNTISGNTLTNTVNTRNVGTVGLGLVTNTTTNNTYCTIQDAINDANTLNGHTITVAAGTYAENVNFMGKSLTLNGPFATTSGCDNSRGTGEAIITGTITVSGSALLNVVIAGFRIESGSSSAITGVRLSGGGIFNNILVGNWTTGDSPNISGIATGTSAPVNPQAWTIHGNSITGYRFGLNLDGAGGVTGTVSENCISQNQRGIQTQSALHDVTSNIQILRNNISDNVQGIRLARGNSTIQGNTISNNTLFGISPGLSSATMDDLTITENFIAGSPVGLLFANAFSSALNLDVSSNSITGNTLAISSTVVPNILASCNWFGDVDAGTVAGLISGNVTVVPWLVNNTDVGGDPTDGFQSDPLACLGGPVQVYNGPTLISGHVTIQAAIDAVTTLTGFTVRIATGTYTEDVNATAAGKNLIFAPGASPGCVNIVGNFTLNAGDVLEIEIDDAAACTGYDQFTVSGTVTLGGATLTIPAGMYFPVTGDLITIIDGSSPIVGMFVQGNFVTDGNGYTYYISYAGNDVVLTKCCGALLDLGIYNHIAPTPAGNKLQVKLRPNLDVFNGTYSNSVFAIRTLTANGVVFTNLGSPFGYSQVPYDPMPPYDPTILTDGLYSYYFFRFDTDFTGVNWPKDDDVLLLTLGYSCVGNATFELISDAFAIANGAQYYQELGGQNAAGNFSPAPSATSPVSVSIVATNNGPLCASMPIDLNSTTSNGSPASPPPAYTYLWEGPDTYTNNVDDPLPIDPSTLAMAGTYTVTVTDGNGCTATGTTNVVVLANGGCVKNVDLTTYYPTITQAINVPETLDGHTLEVPAGNWPENVNVIKELTINGANVGLACDDPTRGAESFINGGLGTAVTISSNGVTIDGFQIEGNTGVSSTTFEGIAIINNKVNARVVGINSALVATTLTDGYTIQDNCIDLTRQAYATFGFTTNPTLSATQAPGVWYTDRYAPAGFVAEVFSGNSRLKHSINAADCESCRPGPFTSVFYNTQGRKYDTPGASAFSIELYVPSDWASTGRRMAGLWGTAFNTVNAISFYPIIEFTSDGGVPRFRAWDGVGWQDMGLPDKFSYDNWYALNIEIVGANLVYSVGDLSLTLPGNSSVSIGNVILQGHNTASPGVTYDIYWDNLWIGTSGSPGTAAVIPTVGVALTVADGAQAVVLTDNHVADAFYGYGLYDVATTPRTTVRGGTYTNLMQGVAVTNTLDNANYAASTVGVEDLSMTSFAGDHPAIPAANFHSGVYAFTGGSNTAAVVDILVDNVIVSNTGKISPNSAGIHFADFSTGAGNRLTAEVKNSEISSNLNRGVYVRGGNATALVRNNEILFNGADPHGTGGNDGYGIIVNEEGSVSLQNNTITNPPAQAGIYPVTAMFIGVAPEGSITAFENNINRNGNGSLTANTYPIAHFTATCNWWQSADIDVVDGLVDGNVLFVPYLIDGTDTDMGARGFIPTLGSCVNPTRWYVNDDALTDDVFTLGLGNDLNQGTKRRPFRTIGKAVTTVQTTTSPVPGPNNNTIFVDAGMYNEQVVVPNTIGSLEIKGVGPCTDPLISTTTMVDFTGTVTGKPTLFDIAGDGTVIDGIHFKVDLTKLSSAIIASHSALDNITVKNNCIDPYQSIPLSNFGSYGNRNAISINYNGGINYRVAAGGVNNIVVDNNRVTATVVGTILGDGDDIAFRSAVSVDEGAGTYTRNTFQSINHDILVRFNSNGPVVIGGSMANANTFLGGGVQYSDPNAGGGAVDISHNTFNGSVSGSVMRLQDNYHNAPVTVSNNTLTHLRWGISLENFRNVSVTDNTFTPLALFTTFRHITVNTKTLASDTTGITPQQINGVFTGNTFNALGTVGGTAMAFYNHRMSPMNLGAFTVGTMGSPNVFAPNFTWAVYLGDQSGPTIPAPVDFPEYALGANSETNMGCWYRDINIEKNTFDVGAGAQYPQFMDHAQRLALEAILWHLPDNSCLGELIYFNPVELTAKVFLQGPYDSTTGQMKDDLRTPTLLIPSAEPYTAINTAFPTSFTKVNNFVTESGVAGSVFAVTGDNAIVDWVWLELRDKTDNTVVLATRSALVQRDGDIVDLDGTSAVLFPDSYADDYFVLVRHRNHLGAMTASAIDLTGAHFVDFTVASEPTFGTTGTSARKLIKTATYGLIAGNTLPKIGGGYQIIYNNANNDRASILNVVGASTPLNTVSNVYMLEDVNMDGKVRYNNAGNDRVIILNNVGASTPLNIITQQPNF